MLNYCNINPLFTLGDVFPAIIVKKSDLRIESESLKDGARDPIVVEPLVVEAHYSI